MENTVKLFCYITIFLSFLTGCHDQPWNDPYPFEAAEANSLYFAFTSRPHHLDPARSYTEPEWRLICQIYEPPLQYNYLKRPLTLEPLTAEALPEILYFDEAGNKISDPNAMNVAYSEYWIKIKPGIFYEPHPAFAKAADGKYLYQGLTEQETSKYKILNDFKETGTKELTADDYVYQIKRLAEPRLSCPIFEVMANYIEGLRKLRAELLKIRTLKEVDLRNFDLPGAQVIDRYTYRVRLKGKYPQFRYWLAMPFFAPVPAEVALFFAQPGLEKNNISLDWYPIGTGPYEMTENNPDKRITFQRNPNYREEFYPVESEKATSGKIEKTDKIDKTESEKHDKMDTSEKIAQTESTKKIPSVDKIIFTLEEEDIPYWNKFLQGYYDMSGISSDTFGTAINFSPRGTPEITAQLQQKGIQLRTSLTPGLWSWGFNMLDETVGGNSERARVLRKAISLAFDVSYFIDIFINGRGMLARGPIPPDLFGFETQPTNNSSTSKTAAILEAKKMLAAAGIQEGLMLYMDVAGTGDPEDAAIQTFLRQQFQRLGIHLVIRATDFNRYQEKLKQGRAQIFFWGWQADYPDPENFLFLFYGKNASALFEGENVTNYQNPEYDKLFEKMRLLSDGPERLSTIAQMITILNRDQPCVWGFYPKAYALHHQWVKVGNPSGIINNTMKYFRVDPDIRAKYRLAWNKPDIFPLILMVCFALLICLLIYFRYRQQEHSKRLRI